MRPIISENTEKPVGPYSPGVEANGWVFISSQMGTENGKMAEGVYDQTVQAMRNVEKVLAAANAGVEHLVKVTVFLKDVDDFQTMNEAYRSFLGGGFPARSTIAVDGLPCDALVEIEAIAYCPEAKGDA